VKGVDVMAMVDDGEGGCGRRHNTHASRSQLHHHAGYHDVFARRRHHDSTTCISSPNYRVIVVLCSNLAGLQDYHQPSLSDSCFDFTAPLEFLLRGFMLINIQDE
jgi:hypothetical protein